MTKRVLFLTSFTNSSNDASSENTNLRIEIVRKLGVLVKIYKCGKYSFLRDLINIAKLLKKTNIIFIRVDGSAFLDKFTLIKFVFPRKKIIWEIHGVPEEEYSFKTSFKVLINVTKNNLKRALLSLLVDAHIFISQEILKYCRGRFFIRKYFIIPNFIDDVEQRSNLGKFKSSPVTKLLGSTRLFKVFWGGNSRMPWQALDLVEEVAKETYKKDKSIIFLIAGHQSWHKFTWSKNLILLGEVPRGLYLKLIEVSHVCLGLYRKPKKISFYFSPLKVLNYMSLGKVVIASSFSTIRAIIKNGENGFLTNNSSDDIVKKLIFLKKNKNKTISVGANAKNSINKKGGKYMAKKKYKLLLAST